MSLPVADALIDLQQTPVFGWVLVFFAAYPIVTSIMWVTTALIFRWRWEDAVPPAPKEGEGALPFVSVLMPAHNERAVIARSVAAVLRMKYPAFELIVIDDGSTDGTLEALGPLADDPRVRLVRKPRNEGKALALNDALPLARGEILLGLDADAEPDPYILHHLVPHFASPRVAAVTGNPRVRNTDTVLARLQAVEFSSIISLLRRAQRVWGRIVTVSGVVAAVPLSLRALMKQRLRWARGLAQVLHKHADVMTTWKSRRLWPVFIESSLSVLWAVSFVFLTVVWTAAAVLGVPLVGASPIPNLWGMTIGTLCLVQLTVGLLIDRRYDPDSVRFLPYAVWYPVIYWALLAATTVIALPYLFKRPTQANVRWSTTREGPES